MSDEPKGLRREPKAVTKPRVGNPWRESIQGNVNRPIMRVRGGAPSGMPVPSWQSDGAPVGARELPSTDTAALEVQSIRRSYGVESPVYVPGDWQRVSPDTEASRAYTVSRPAASPAESRAMPTIDGAAVNAAFEAYDTGDGNSAVLKRGTSVLWVDGDARARHYRAATELARWEALYVKALESGHASFESLPVHPSIVAERTRALQSREAPSYVVVRALPGAPMAHDPSHHTRTVLDALAPRVAQRAPSPVAPAHAAVMGPVLSALFDVMPRTVKGAARKGLAGGLPTSPASGAVHPCQWCDSVACDHARRDDLRCNVYEWAGGDRGPKRPRAQPCAEWTAYVKAREAFKGPRKAHAACLEWIEGGRRRTIDALRALDARGVSIDLDSPRGYMHDGTKAGIRAARAAFKGGVWRDPTSYTYRCGKVHVGRDLAYGREHRGYLYSRVDAAHFALARWDALAELLASAGRGKVDDARAVLASVSDAAPRGVWWGDALCQWRDTHDAHSGAVGALVGVCRARRDTTVATVQPSRVQDTVKRVHRPSPLGEGARDATVELIARKAPTAPARAPMACEPSFTALRPAVARVVAPTGVESIPPRIAGDAPAYPVTPRVRKGDDASQCTPERAPAVWRDAPIEELRQRTRR